MISRLRERVRAHLSRRLDRRGLAATVLVAVAATALGAIGLSAKDAASAYYYYCPGGGSGTYTYCPPTTSHAHLFVIKHVITDDGGVAVASDFAISINLINAEGGNVFPGEEAPGTNKTVTTGNYNVTETGPLGYNATFSADCEATIATDETKTCTITNNDKPAAEKLEDLEDLVGSSNLDDELEKKLLHEIDETQKKLLENKTNEMCDHLDHFLEAVFEGAAKEDPQVSIADAKNLVAAANDIELSIGCFAPGSPRLGGEPKLLDLIETINSLGLNDAVATNLRNRARDAGKDLVDGKNICKRLTDFHAVIAKMLNKGMLTAPQASQLDVAATDVEVELGC